ncbi:MAG: ribonuclease HII [Novosphingobium sp.]
MHKPLPRRRQTPCEGLVVGVDEAGRGPLAGPVVAAAVVLCRPRPAGLDDSKKLTREQRGVVEDRIKRRCQWGVGVVDVDGIERLNIFGATMLAMTLAVEELCAKLGEEPHQVLVDGNLSPAGRRPEWRWPARAIVGGDAIEPCISAASIVAKEHRDRLMREHAKAHPHYGWETNVGYGTPEHLRALRRHGPTPLHRRGFAPVAQLALFDAECDGGESFAPHHDISRVGDGMHLNIS